MKVRYVLSYIIGAAIMGAVIVFLVNFAFGI